MATEILAPMPGTIVNVLVKEGDEVLEYQEVVILEAMKMETPVVAPSDGKVASIEVEKNQVVKPGQLVATLS